MRDALYLRAQAEVCLEIAHHQIDDPITADRFRAAAARYHADAIAAEAKSPAGEAHNNGHAQEPVAEPYRLHRYYFHASGFDHVPDQYCRDDMDAEHVAFQTSMELSRSSERLVVVLVKNERNDVVCTAPRLTDGDLHLYLENKHSEQPPHSPDVQIMSGALNVGRIREDFTTPHEQHLWKWSIKGVHAGPSVMQIQGEAPTLEAAKLGLRSNWQKWLAWAKLAEVH